MIATAERDLGLDQGGYNALVEKLRKNVFYNYGKSNYRNPLDRSVTPICGDIVVVGACPSLDKDKHKLPEMQKAGTKIICMIRALRCIHDIVEPDAVVALEPADIFDDYHKYVGELTALICSLGANPELVQDWPGKIFATLPFTSPECPEIDVIAEETGLPQVHCFNSSLGYIMMLCRLLKVHPSYMGCDFWFYKDKYYASPYTDAPDVAEMHLDERYGAELQRYTSQRFIEQIAHLGGIEPFYILNREKLEALVV